MGPALAGPFRCCRARKKHAAGTGELVVPLRVAAQGEAKRDHALAAAINRC
jgi:hypothetical protein